MSKTERELRDILKRARAILPAEDSPVFREIGAIVANAEDAVDSLESERRLAALGGWPKP